MNENKMEMMHNHTEMVHDHTKMMHDHMEITMAKMQYENAWIACCKAQMAKSVNG